MAGNGRKWSKMGCRGYLVGNGFSRVSCYGQYDSQAGNGRQWWKMADNGRKWQKKVHRGYLVENGFSRVSRQSPTTVLFHYSLSTKQIGLCVFISIQFS